MTGNILLWKSKIIHFYYQLKRRKNWQKRSWWALRFLSNPRLMARAIPHQIPRHPSIPKTRWSTRYEQSIMSKTWAWYKKIHRLQQEGQNRTLRDVHWEFVWMESGKEKNKYLIQQRTKQNPHYHCQDWSITTHHLAMTYYSFHKALIYFIKLIFNQVVSLEKHMNHSLALIHFYLVKIWYQFSIQYRQSIPTIGLPKRI